LNAYKKKITEIKDLKKSAHNCKVNISGVDEYNLNLNLLNYKLKQCGLEDSVEEYIWASEHMNTQENYIKYKLNGAKCILEKNSIFLSLSNKTKTMKDAIKDAIENIEDTDISFYFLYKYPNLNKTSFATIFKNEKDMIKLDTVLSINFKEVWAECLQKACSKSDNVCTYQKMVEDMRWLSFKAC